MKQDCTGCPYSGITQDKGEVIHICALGLPYHEEGEDRLAYFGKVEGPCETLDLIHEEALLINRDAIGPKDCICCGEPAKYAIRDKEGQYTEKVCEVCQKQLVGFYDRIREL